MTNRFLAEQSPLYRPIFIIIHVLAAGLLLSSVCLPIAAMFAWKFQEKWSKSWKKVRRGVFKKLRRRMRKQQTGLDKSDDDDEDDGDEKVSSYMSTDNTLTSTSINDQCEVRECLTMLINICS